MDESCSKYDLMIHSNKRVEKPSNQTTSSSGLKSIDENHSKTDSESGLSIRKQELKEYLTTTRIPDKNITSSYKLHNFSTVNLINFVPKIDDYNKPVKVKSQWTRTSQMELALENSTDKNVLPVNNLSKSEKTNEIFTMDVSPEISINNQINEHTNDTGNTNNKTDPSLNYESHCCVVVHKCDNDSVQVKRKRGRPKKITCNIIDNTSIISNIGNQDPVKTNSVADIEPKITDEPKVIKRGRGRPRKNEIASTSIQVSPIVSSTPEKKRKITKQGTTVIKKQRVTKFKSDQLENEDVNDSKLHKRGPRHPSKLSSSEAIKSLTKKLNKHFLSSDKTEVNENSPESGERSFSPITLFPGDGNDFKCITISRFDDTEKTQRITLARCDTLIEQENITSLNFLEGCHKIINQEINTSISFFEDDDNKSTIQENTTSINFLEDNNKSTIQENTTSVNFLEGCDSLNLQLNTTSMNFFEEVSTANIQDKIDCVSGTRIKIDKFLSESEQDVFSELEEVDWNLAPKRIRSNSVNESTKIRNRRNSLTDNFMYHPSKKSKNTMLEDLKLLKSWKSVSYLERGPNVQVERIIQDELIKKFRSKLKRSRSFPNCLFLDTVIWRYLVQKCEDDNESEDDELDSESDSDSDLDRYENSKPIQEYEPEEKANYTPGNFDNLNMFHSSNDLQSFQIPPNIRDLENSVCDPEQHRDSDRCECRSLENSVPIQQYEPPKEKTDYMFRGLDNLNMFCSSNDLQSFQIPPNISNLKNSESDQEESKGKIRRSKRLNTKVKNSDMLEEEYFLSSENSKIDSLLVADEIRRDNEIHLAEARAKDPELDKKLKKLNFKLITNNLFRPHRKKMGEYTPAEAQELRKLKPRRTINSDTYKCHCKYTRKDWIDKKPGCATECLNRLLNIECGTACGLKSLCTNKQFQNKQFKRTIILKTENKGYGVFALEDIPSGTFVDEYMGEVIDQNEMIKRMKKVLYKDNNYMVQLKHDEIIDATRRGNITRFINHSCEPNCVAEKWNVLGESRMGFFSKQFIKKGEEITFDYSFEIFGDAAQQKCYCGSSKCRGFISKKSRTGDQSSSEDSDDHEDDTTNVKPDACQEKKKEKTEKISNKDRKRLKQLDQQLTDISKLKNKNRSDLESSTLNLNKLMVHITDSMSRSHILKFIRDNDLNCKRLFMNFNGLNIIHSWMTSNNSESLKLEIVKTLSDLPISNRNTITKSKVLDIVAQWANIPLNIKEVIENLDYPISQIKEHEQEIDKLLPDVNNLSPLVQAARVLWKKWIILKIVFKIPKLDRPKEVNFPDDVIQPPVLFSQPEINSVPYHFGNPTVPNQPSKISCVESQGNGQTNYADTLKKVTHHPNQKTYRDKNKTVFEWNKKQWNYLPFKTNKVITSAMVNNSINSVLNPKQSITSTFIPRIIHQEIPTIESSTLSKNMKWTGITENTSTVYELTDSTKKVNSTCAQDIKIIDTEPIVYYPIEEIITTNQTWNLPPPTIVDLYNGSTLLSMLKTVPPCLPNDFISNTPDKASQCSFSNDNTTWCTMRPENVMYDARHPSIQEQLAFLPIDITLKKSTKTQLYVQNTNAEKTESTKNYKAVQPLDDKMREKLFKQCRENVQQLVDKGILNVDKTARQNYVDQSPIKILQSFFNKKIVKSPNVSPEDNQNQYVLPNLIKRIKVMSNCYRKQPSKIIEINNLAKSNSQKSKNDIFRIKEDQKTEITDTTSAALTLHNEQLRTVPEKLNLNKMFNKNSLKINTKNKFALKILNGLIKHNSNMPKSFILQFLSDTKIITHNPSIELELHYKLIPSVQNILCAKLNRGVGKDIINVYKQKIVMKYDEKKAPEPVTSSVLKENMVLSSNSIEIPQFKKGKRKMPLPPLDNIKTSTIVDLSVNNVNKSRNQAKIINKTNDNTSFKKLLPSVINKNNCQQINTSVTSQEQEPKISSIALINTNANEFKQKPSTSSQLIPSTVFLKIDANDFRLEPSTSSHVKPDIDQLKINLNELSEEPSDQLIINITSPKTNANEIRPKPLMKCLPFNKVDDIIITELEKNDEFLDSSLSIDSTNVLPSTSSALIDPIVQNFKNSISQKKSMIRANLVDDPIVRDYIERTHLQTHETKRKCKLPESMMSLPVEVLDLIPDNQKEIKYVIDFYHAMATVIVKVLDVYVKKSCKQGRIKNDDDFKYLAKKLNSNILFKELQVKKVEDLRISDSVKQKVEQYIKKYMLKYGKLYRRKSTDQ